jgi:hypothetical protein
MVRGHSTHVPQLIVSAQSVARAHGSIALVSLLRTFRRNILRGTSTHSFLLTDLSGDVPQMDFDRYLSWDVCHHLLCAMLGAPDRPSE